MIHYTSDPQPNEHIIFEMKMPSKMKKRFELANMVKTFISKATLTPYERIINEQYAKAIDTMAWTEFQYESLKEPYNKHLCFSHTIDADINTGMLTFKRRGSAEPTIYEKLNLSANLK